MKVMNGKATCRNRRSDKRNLLRTVKIAVLQIAASILHNEKLSLSAQGRRVSGYRGPVNRNTVPVAGTRYRVSESRPVENHRKRAEFYLGKKIKKFRLPPMVTLIFIKISKLANPWWNNGKLSGWCHRWFSSSFSNFRELAVFTSGMLAW